MSINFESELMNPENWSKDDEVYLLASTLNNKPTGIDKHFQMAIIWSRFVSQSKKSVSSEVLWKKLNSLYNLQYFNETEPIPFDTTEEDFLLPAEIIPESYLKNLSDEDRKYIDFSGVHKKYISVTDIDEEDSEPKSLGKLKGSEKMKWFENPQSYKTVGKNYDSKVKLDINESSNESTSETPTVIRQYGKAGEVSSGTILTVSIPPGLMDELDDNSMEVESVKEESIKTSKTSDTKGDENKSSDKRVDDKVPKTKRKRVVRKGNTLTAMNNEDSENILLGKQLTRSAKSVEPASSITRLRKASIASHEASSGTETEKESTPANEENSRNVRRRCSQRVSVSESKSDSSKVVEPSNKTDVKRKSIARR